MNKLMLTVFSTKKVEISFLIIFLFSLVIRFYFFPYNLPLVVDGADNFTYATAINFYGHLPTEWTPINNGWPIFLSFWFSIINLEDTFQYMQLQRIISVVLSSLITIPVYFLCRKFFDEKIALIGVALFAFEPRIILNSFLGITEPLFILLGASSLVLFLKYEKREMFIAFILVSCCTIVRSEGLFLFFTLTILFFIKYKISKEILKTYLPCVIIFMLILIPIMNYRIDVAGYDGIFQRAVIGTDQIISMTNQNGNSEIIDGLTLFIKYLGWIMIPNFLIFVPFGIIQYFRKRPKGTNFIIIYLVISSIPILYAYFVQAQDTRYLYILYPIFCLVSLFTVKSFISKLPKKNIMISIIVVSVCISSIGFYEFEKIDYKKEVELYEIAKIVGDKTSGLNFHPSETRYIRATEIPDNWPFLFQDSDYEIKLVLTGNHENLEDFILDSKNDLSHLIIDENPKLPVFLQQVFNNEEKYEYLIKEFDSKEEGFSHHMKLFKIDYKKFENISDE